MWNGDSLIAENGLHPHSRCSNKSTLHTLPGKSHLLLLLAPQFLSPVYTSALSSTPGYSATYWASRPEWLTGNSYSVRSKLSLLLNPAPLYLLDSPHSHPSQNLSSYLFFSFFFSLFSPHPLGFKPLLILHIGIFQISPFLSIPTATILV